MSLQWRTVLYLHYKRWTIAIATSTHQTSSFESYIFLSLQSTANASRNRTNPHCQKIRTKWWQWDLELPAQHEISVEFPISPSVVSLSYIPFHVGTSLPILKSFFLSTISETSQRIWRWNVFQLKGPNYEWPRFLRCTSKILEVLWTWPAVFGSWPHFYTEVNYRSPCERNLRIRCVLSDTSSAKDKQMGTSQVHEPDSP